MKENLKISGKIHMLPKQLSKKDGSLLNKYEFRIIKNENSDFPPIIPFNMLGKSFESFPNVKIGDMVEVEFSISGREWQDRCFGENLAWAVRLDSSQTMDKALQDAVKKDADTTIDDDSDLPF
jgi:hypothetical protein